MQNRRVRRSIAVRVLAHFAIFAAVTAGALVLSTTLPTRPTVVWSDASGDPAPASFRFAAFPVGGRCDILDEPGGSVIGSSDRALVNELRELGEAYVRVRHAGLTGVVRASDLSYTQPTTNSATMLERLIVEKRSGGSDSRWYACSIRTNAAEPSLIEFIEAMDDRRTTHVYIVTGTGVRPVRLETEHALQSLGVAAPTLVAWAAASFGIGASLAVRLRRLLRTPPAHRPIVNSIA
ncbi:MAG: hypothetical protein K2Q20_08015 [Phycisphaerales bacterium]|nr:hypothetical protein [Phycisphaerales bacterium]